MVVLVESATEAASSTASVTSVSTLTSAFLGAGGQPTVHATSATTENERIANLVMFISILVLGEGYRVATDGDGIRNRTCNSIGIHSGNHCKLRLRMRKRDHPDNQQIRHAI